MLDVPLHPAGSAGNGDASVPPAPLRPPAPPAPVWFSVLRAAGCVARARDCAQPVAWNFDGRRALYTNLNAESVVVVPFAVRVGPGQSLAVVWERGETAYSLHAAA